MESFESLVSRWGRDVDRVAWQVVRTSGRPASELARLRWVGQVALWEASTRFDPSRNVEFWPFAERRVRGAMYDEMREADHLSHHGRKRVRDGVLVSDPWSLAHRAPLTAAMGQSVGDVVESLEDREMLSRVAEALRGLSGGAGDVLRRVYVDGATFGEVAAELGLSEGRVYQLRREGIELIRGRIGLE